MCLQTVNINHGGSLYSLSVPLQVRVRVRGPKTMNSTRPQHQYLDAKAELVLSLLGKDLCLVLCRCGLVCLVGGYGAGVIEMLLMMSGDVEPNPGPSEFLTIPIAS